MCQKRSLKRGDIVMYWTYENPTPRTGTIIKKGFGDKTWMVWGGCTRNGQLVLHWVSEPFVFLSCQNINEPEVDAVEQKLA